MRLIATTMINSQSEAGVKSRSISSRYVFVPLMTMTARIAQKKPGREAFQ